tara:strand:- start:1001 stop:1549 length:549 start_codon:yes stop_codon:yes gene_type:complete
MSDRKDLKLDLSNEAFFIPPADFIQPPPLIRERQSDYGMFDEYFENDVLNWFRFIDNKKKLELIIELSTMLKYNLQDNFNADTPHPRVHVQSPNPFQTHVNVPRLGRQTTGNSIAPPKMQPFFEEEEQITPPKTSVPDTEPLDMNSLDKYKDTLHVFNTNFKKTDSFNEFLEDDSLINKKRD